MNALAQTAGVIGWLAFVFALVLMTNSCGEPAEAPPARSCPPESEIVVLKLTCRERIVRECGETAAPDCPAFVECSALARKWEACR